MVEIIKGLEIGGEIHTLLQQLKDSLIKEEIEVKDLKDFLEKNDQKKIKRTLSEEVDDLLKIIKRESHDDYTISPHLFAFLGEDMEDEKMISPSYEIKEIEGEKSLSDFENIQRVSPIAGVRILKNLMTDKEIKENGENIYVLLEDFMIILKRFPYGKTSLSPFFTKDNNPKMKGIIVFPK